MKHFASLRTVLASLAVATLAAVSLHAQQKESITVQTMTYGSPHDALFVFPPDSVRFEKILMHYKLRCPFDGPCGEWDYLAYIYLHKKTGRIDSTLDTATNYSIDGQTPDSISYMLRPSWRYIPHFQKYVVRSSTISFDSALIGTGTGTSMLFGGGTSARRAQYLWRSSELKSAGLKQGEITGLRFNFASGGGELRNMTIRMKNSSLDSVTTAGIEDEGWTTVYGGDPRLGTLGWNSIGFSTPFVWNGSSNIAVDITVDAGGDQGGPRVYGGDPGFPAGIFSARNDRALRFEGRDYIEVPPQALAPVDSFITVSFWQYGDPAHQPQEQSIFEAFDQFGRRVLNVHLPWGDTLIYWDAGTNSQGSYDRLIKKATDPDDYEGRWNHWVFTKNVQTTQMKIYLNGKQWASGNSKRRPIGNIASFKLGSMGDGTRSYDGMIDEFAIWDAELPATFIGSMWRNDVKDYPSYRDNLILYYPFDSLGAMAATDASGHGFHGTLVGPPQSIATDGPSINRSFTVDANRPNVVFEQGVYTSRVDSLLRIDSVENAPMQIVLFEDASNPGTPTDTLTVWPTYHRYTFNNAGVAIDSVPVAPDATLRLERRPYYRKYEGENRFEIGRYITPYGNGLNLGDGFVWTFDVSDYRTLLADTVRLVSINTQELVDISFEMIKGVPPRDPIAIENIWSGAPAYGTSAPIEEFLAPRQVQIPADAANVRLKMRSTGHGFGGTENCAEFCPKEHSILVDGTERFKRLLWKDDCGLNPVYPQGGTWVYNRANWCPGDAVPTYDFELTPYVTPGSTVTLDYNVQPYTWNGQGTTPYYVVETQLVSYSAPNFTLDASVEGIKSPSTTDIFKRMNPICNNPVITIRNTGTTPLTSLKITYGVAGAPQSVHTWTGSLGFLESTDVQLGAISWSGTEKKFRVEISEPNGGADQYANNNTMESEFTAPPVYPSAIVLELKTNENGYETSYELRNSDGVLIHSRSDLDAATTYRDTLNLPNGCYEFRLRDTGGDGLDWWANRSEVGTGSMRIRRASNGATVKSFGGDFGSEIYQQFTVGYDLSSAEEIAEPAGEDQVGIFPNPTSGEFSVDLNLARRKEVVVSVRDLLGRTVHERTLKNVLSENIRFDLSDQPEGVYVVTVQTDNSLTSRKVVVQ